MTTIERPRRPHQVVRKSLMAALNRWYRSSLTLGEALGFEGEEAERQLIDAVLAWAARYKRQCAHCGLTFYTDTPGKTHYCSAAHRNRAYRRRKKEQARATER
jgi:hypothetical protein